MKFTISHKCRYVPIFLLNPVLLLATPENHAVNDIVFESPEELSLLLDIPPPQCHYVRYTEIMPVHLRKNYKGFYVVGNVQEYYNLTARIPKYQLNWGYQSIIFFRYPPLEGGYVFKEVRTYPMHPRDVLRALHTQNNLLHHNVLYLGLKRLHNSMSPYLEGEILVDLPKGTYNPKVYFYLVTDREKIARMSGNISRKRLAQNSTQRNEIRNKIRNKPKRS